MSFKIIIGEKLKPVMARLKKKDKATFEALEGKIIQISQCDAIAVQHYKNLEGNMSGLKRVHIGCFVLTFKVEGETVIFEDLAHHEEAYGR